MAFNQTTDRKHIFSGKQTEILEQLEHFWKIENAAPDTQAYFNRDKRHKYAEGLGPWVKYETIFTNPKNKRLAENDEVYIIGLWHSFDIVQHVDNPGRASMSMIHLAGIPKAAVFNGVSLNYTNVHLIDSIISLFNSSWREDRFRKDVVDHQLVRIKDDRDRQLQVLNKLRKPASENLAEQIVVEEKYQIAKCHYEELKSKALNIQVDDFAFGLHLYPDNSISHLHMHIIATPPDLRQYSTLIHDKKTKDALEVRDIIKSQTFGYPTNSIQNLFPE